MFVIEKDWLFC